LSSARGLTHRSASRLQPPSPSTTPQRAAATQGAGAVWVVLCQVLPLHRHLVHRVHICRGACAGSARGNGGRHCVFEWDLVDHQRGMPRSDLTKLFTAPVNQRKHNQRNQTKSLKAPQILHQPRHPPTHTPTHPPARSWPASRSSPGATWCTSWSSSPTHWARRRPRWWQR